MNISSYLFGFIIATLLGALFHIWRDGGIGRLLMYLLLSWFGFFIGHLAAKSFELKFMNVGPVNLAGGIVGSVILLFLGHWIGRIDQNILPKGK